MKQILQNLKTGDTELADVPCPSVSNGQLLIRTSYSLISAGTERMLIDFGKANLIEKARQQPDKVRMVIDKAKTDGLIPTIEAVMGKLEQPLPLGYCNVGKLLELGPGVTGFALGERIVSNGKHAEIVSIPTNLCARIPDSVSNEAATFTVIGAIALQGIRLAKPTLGECVVVIGLGLIGQIAVQLLRANGCRVMGIDFDPTKLELAKSFGAEVVDLSAGADPVKAAEYFSRGQGVDAVLVTAATKSSEPIHQAALMSRKRGRIVLVGVTGLNLSREDFFKKELTFQVSASYGPGRYDTFYEEKGHDYPIGFVRWTEQRNFEAILDMLADGRLNVEPLISHRFDLNDAVNAYSLVASQKFSMGILLKYSQEKNKSDQILKLKTINLQNKKSTNNQDAKDKSASIAFIGSGNYATAVLIPAFKKAKAHLFSVSSSGGSSAAYAAKKYDFEQITTDIEGLFAKSNIDAFVIATRHNSHASYVLKALQHEKSVFVEKPLCLTLKELAEIEKVLELSNLNTKRPYLMVGFNRRFSPHIQKIKSLLSAITAPKSFVLTINAGAIPSDHWTQDIQVGGGRIIGEGCHFIDLLRFLAGSKILKYSCLAMDSSAKDTITLQLKFEDGSIGTIHYFSNGTKAFPKERLEIFAAGRILQLDNFIKLKAFGWPGFKSMNLWRQDKGQRRCVEAFINAIQTSGDDPIPLDEIIEVARVTIELAEQVKSI